MKQKHVVIVIPTYNERENILRLLKTINWNTALPKQSKYIFSILVTDDNSPDGTGELVENYMKNHPNVHISYGRKNGLGKAYIRGINRALHSLNADIIMQMDADFSHDPQYILPLLKKVSRSHQYVIGSRYVMGGTIPQNWSYFRILNSKIGNIFARYIAGIKNIKDCTSGFKAIDANLLRSMNLEKIGANGFSFQMKLLYEALKKGARVTEVPINFADRGLGHSKMGWKDISEFIINAFKIRTGNIKMTWRNSALILTIPSSWAGLGYLIFEQNALFRGIGLYIFVAFTLFILFQSMLTLYGMIYAWNSPERVAKNNSPKQYYKPNYSFTAILPALHEENVIARTIQSVNEIKYPTTLKEIIIVCRFDDSSTIEIVNSTIKRLGNPNIRLIIPDFKPRNKPDKLNYALKHARNQIVAIFDAEDSPHKEIYNIVNTVIMRDNADVVQSGVQLINFRSKWFSTLNVLEYFFWFKSVLHMFISRMHVVFLGGNTVFFKKQWLNKVNGWDADCLTEDADIGLRLTAAGANIRIVYDEIHATREETPPNLISFIKQRTRWNQGFIQIFRNFKWNNLPSFSQKFWAAYLLIWPEIQAVMFIYIIFSIIMMLTVKLPIILTLISFLPLYILVLQVVFLNVGLYEFAKKYDMRYPVWIALKVTLTFFPFQLVLGFSAVRAVIRELLHKNGWEKTEHINAHRTLNFKRDRGFVRV